MPPAPAVTPASCAVSCTVAPEFPADSESSVVMVGLFGATTTGSSLHPLVNGLLFESPLNDATQ